MWKVCHYHALRNYCIENSTRLDETRARELGPEVSDEEWKLIYRDAYYSDKLRVPGWLRKMEDNEEFTEKLVKSWLNELVHENIKEDQRSPSEQERATRNIAKLLAKQQCFTDDRPSVVSRKRAMFKEEFKGIVCEKQRWKASSPPLKKRIKF